MKAVMFIKTEPGITEYGNSSIHNELFNDDDEAERRYNKIINDPSTTSATLATVDKYHYVHDDDRK